MVHLSIGCSSLLCIINIDIFYDYSSLKTLKMNLKSLKPAIKVRMVTIKLRETLSLRVTLKRKDWKFNFNKTNLQYVLYYNLHELFDI